MLVLRSLTPERPLRYNEAVKVNLAQFGTVLFDLDGTLVETNIDFTEMRRGVRSIIARYVEEEGIREDMDILQAIASASNFLEMRGEHHMSACLKKEANGLMEQMENTQCSHPTMIPLARELLVELKSRRVNVCVVTRNNRNVALRLMEQCDLPYDLLLAREDIPLPKPHPDHLLRGIHLSGGDPSSSCMVGDHWMDIIAGKKAGISTVGLLKGRPKSYFQPEPPHFFVEDITALFEGLD
jgi:phosphoglycolate phosphatase